MRVIVVNGTHYAIGKQFLSRLQSNLQISEAQAMYGKARELGSGNAASEAGKLLVAQLDLHGIPRTVLDAGGNVLNPQAKSNRGAFEANGTWSREREILAQSAKS